MRQSQVPLRVFLLSPVMSCLSSLTDTCQSLSWLASCGFWNQSLLALLSLFRSVMLPVASATLNAFNHVCTPVCLSLSLSEFFFLKILFQLLVWAPFPNSWSLSTSKTYSVPLSQPLSRDCCIESLKHLASGVMISQHFFILKKSRKNFRKEVVISQVLLSKCLALCLGHGSHGGFKVLAKFPRLKLLEGATHLVLWRSACTWNPARLQEF